MHVNTGRVLPGHPIIFLKSNKFNMAAISVKRSLHRTLSDHTHLYLLSLTCYLITYIFTFYQVKLTKKAPALEQECFDLQSEAWNSLHSVNLGLLPVVLIFWIGSRELAAPKILRIGWKENSIFCPVLTCNFLYFQAPIIH